MMRPGPTSGWITGPINHTQEKENGAKRVVFMPAFYTMGIGWKIVSSGETVFL